ncbi:MAG: preprotein translocase subunit SecG [Candidatus Shapirobacteria bacterium]
MKVTLSIIQIILSVVLSALIFLQAKGNNESNSNILSDTAGERRGWEKFIFNLTIFITFLFLVSSIVQFIS